MPKITLTITNGKISNRYTRHSVSSIRKGEHFRLGHQFKCGFLESNYYLPVRYAPLEIEITVVSDADEPVIKGVSSASATTIGGDRGGAYFTEGDTTTKWQLNHIILRAEVVSLDSAVNNNITSHLLQGGSLKIVYPMYHTITQTFNASGTEINMNVVKSASKLNGAFITCYRTQRGNYLTNGKEDNYYLPDNYVHKRFNYFYNPMINSRFSDRGVNATGDDAGYGFADKNYNISWILQIGNKKYPEFESQSLAEHMYFLRRMLNYMNPDQDSCSITYEQYATNTFILGITFEKMNEASMTGINSKMGSLLTAKFRPFKTLTDNEMIQEVFCHLLSENVLEIRSDSSIVYD